VVSDDTSFSLRRGDASGSVLAIIAIGAVVRFLLATTAGLGVDESYAVAIARQYSLSYFDHPPLHFWIAGTMAKLAHSETPMVVRLPFVLCFAGTTWSIFSIGRRFFGDRAGLIGALLLNVSAVFSLSTGGWVLPDGPLMLLTSAAVDRISALVFSGAEKQPAGGWLLAGLLVGLAMLSKYHGVFVLAGTAGFLVTAPRFRKQLATPGPWLGTAIALACFAPVIIWNAQHHWASFAFQGARATPASGIHFDTFLANIGGQMAWVLPWIFIPLAASAWRALRAGPRDEKRWFLLWLAAGPIVVFTLVSLKGDVGLPHWQAPGWLFVFPLLGAGVAERLDAATSAAASATRRWLRWSVVSYAVLILVLGTHAAWGWMARLAPKAFERGDPTADLVTWRMLRPTLEGLGYVPGTAFIGATSWIQAGKASIAMGPDMPVLCLCSDPHHFYYAQNDSAFLGGDAIIVKKVRENDDVLERFAPYFERIDPLTRFGVYRGRQMVMMLDVYRARNFRALYPTDQPR
jgi:4-amino-4-deoxy-L-arabinose transferase-like glycosyltransferase